MNYSIKLDLLRIKGATVCNIKGKTATKKCIVIPVEDNEELFDGAKGIYLNVTAVEKKEKQYDNTHFVRVSLSKEDFDKLSEEQRKSIPIIGSMKPIESKKTEAIAPVIDVEDDLPF